MLSKMTLHPSLFHLRRRSKVDVKQPLYSLGRAHNGKFSQLLFLLPFFFFFGRLDGHPFDLVMNNNAD